MHLYILVSNVNNKSSRSASKSKRTLHAVPCRKTRVATVVAQYEYQSTLCTDTEPADSQTHKLTTFFDENPSFTCATKTSDDPTRDASMSADANLSTFFERPVEIFDVQWLVGSPLNIQYPIWQLWFNNPRVQNRLANFRNFRGNLHIKLVLNGNAFYWGSAMASYVPYTESTPFINTDVNFKGDKMSASQRPHILIDPTTSQGGQLDLPFFWHHDSIDITKDAMAGMGSIWLNSLVDLNNTQNTTSITINGYAWMTDVKLSGPTQVNPLGLAPQSDEYSDGGPISKPAAIVAKVAGKLENVPVIGKYAMATKMAASTAGAIAKQFGYSRPAEISNPGKFKLTQTGDMATTDSVDTSNLLTINSKAEVTIDPSTVGLSNVDELAFKHLYQKESWLTSVPWEVGFARNKMLFSMPITPMICNAQARTIPPSIVGTNLAPCGFVAAPFRFWKGRMKIRLQFVGSAFHKGRIRLSWDPAFGDQTVEDNTVYNQIVDISDQRDFTMIVGWGSHKPALLTGGIPAATNYLNGAMAPMNDFLHNGALKLSVVNPLVYPSSTTSDVYFNVFVSFDELEVFDPDSDNFQLHSYFPPPPAVQQESEYEEQSEHIGDSKPVDNAAPSDAPLINTVGGVKDVIGSAAFMHGDPVSSFRQIMKRYCYLETIVYQEQAVAAKFNSTTISRRAVPLYRGPQVGGIHATGTANYVPMVPFAYLAGAYAGWRGSVRYKAYTSGNIFWPHTYKVSRGGSGAFSVDPQTYTYSPDNMTVQRAAVDESFSGSHVVADIQGNIMEFSIPYYLSRRFAYEYLAPNSTDPFNGFRIEATSLVRPNQLTESRSFIDFYQSVGDDMNFFYFRGVPTMYFYDQLPVA